jgi:hypothetical protein
MTALDGGVIRQRDVDDLVDVQPEVAISILRPVDRRLPHNSADRLRLRHLVDKACKPTRRRSR